MAKKEKKIWKHVKTHTTITFGLILTALGWMGFLIPAQITGGGISGLSALLFYATKFPIGVSYLIFNVALILLAIKILGLKFGIQTIYGVIGLSLFFSILQPLFTAPIVKDAFMASVIGGILSGTGIGLVFSQGGSTGGTDIIAMIVNKYRNISLGRLILYQDIVIIASSYFLFHSIEKIVYGYVTMAITSYVIDLVLEGANQSYQIMVFSKKHEVIALRISTEVGRGITLLEGEGWFSKDKMKILLVVVKKYESSQVLRIIKDTDPDAFISVGNSMGVYGEGFERIKV
jgi:uncharacterized membrane-anchored protein YitT (DUF2179 family)